MGLFTQYVGSVLSEMKCLLTMPMKSHKYEAGSFSIHFFILSYILCIEMIMLCFSF